MPCPFSILLGSLNDAITIVAVSPLDRLITIRRTTLTVNTTVISGPFTSSSSSSILGDLWVLIQTQGLLSLWNGTGARIYASSIGSAVAEWCNAKVPQYQRRRQQQQKQGESSDNNKQGSGNSMILMFLATMLPPSIVVYPLIRASVELSLASPTCTSIDGYFRNVAPGGLLSVLQELYRGFWPLFIGSVQQHLATSMIQSSFSQYKKKQQQNAGKQQPQKEQPQTGTSSSSSLQTSSQSSLSLLSSFWSHMKRFISTDFIEQTFIAMIVGTLTEPWFYLSYQQMTNSARVSTTLTTASSSGSSQSSISPSPSFNMFFPPPSLGVLMMKIVIEQSIRHSNVFDYLRKAILNVASYFH